MKRRGRALTAIFAILIGLIVYAGLIGILAERLAPMTLAAEIAFYTFFGLVWIWPVRALFRWVGRTAR